MFFNDPTTDTEKCALTKNSIFGSETHLGMFVYPAWVSKHALHCYRAPDEHRTRLTMNMVRTGN